MRKLISIAALLALMLFGTVVGRAPIAITTGTTTKLLRTNVLPSMLAASTREKNSAPVLPEPRKTNVTAGI
jgi:hypothetical protein